MTERPTTDLTRAVEQWFSAPLVRAGFVRTARNAYVKSGDCELAVRFRPKALDDHLSFYTEWSVTPVTTVRFLTSRRGEPVGPDAGLLCGRVHGEKSPFVQVDRSWWSIGSLDPESFFDGVALFVELFDRNFLTQFARWTDRDTLLAWFDEGATRQRSALPFGRTFHHLTPNSWPERYIALYLDDGPLDTLQTLLSECVPSDLNRDFLTWWRTELDARTT